MYTKKVLMVERDFISYVKFDTFNPNFQRKINDYVVTIHDNEDRLRFRIQSNHYLGQVDEYLYYNSEGNLEKIISKKYDEGNKELTYLSVFEYYDKNVLKKTTLIKEESFFSLNKLGYTYDGLNIMFDIPKDYNQLIESKILSYEEVKAYSKDNLFFYNELNYSEFVFANSEEIIESTDDFIKTQIIKLTQNNHSVIREKKYGNRFYNKGLLIEQKMYVKMNNDFVADGDSDYYSEISGNEVYGYYNKQLNYIENSFYSLSISLDPEIGNIKLEQAILVDRERKSVSKFYTIYEEQLENF